MVSLTQRTGEGSPRWRAYALCAAVVALALAVISIPANAAGGCTVPNVKKLTLKKATTKLRAAGCGAPKVKKQNSSNVKKGLIIKQAPGPKKKLGPGKKVTVWVSLGKKLCVVTRRNSNGKVVPVYVTKTVIKIVKGKKKKVKVKVKKMGPCPKKKKSTSSGVPVTIDLIPDSHADIDFGAFQREIPLTGELHGFIVGKGFKLGQDNQIQLTRGHIGLGQTGIFIDDVCNGQVTDSIRVDPSSFTEIDPGSTGNTVNVAANASVTGLLHMRVQTSLQMRNGDDGCNQPYFTTGWTDFTVPLFVKGKISAGSQGLLTTINVGETVLDNLSACLAPGPPSLPCNGFAIPFPGVLTAHITTVVHIGK